jgi:hypothetical protein
MERALSRRCGAATCCMYGKTELNYTARTHTRTRTHTQHVPQGRAGGGADGNDAVTEAWGPKAAEKGAQARQGRADRPQKHGEGSRNAQLTGAENRVAAGVFLNILINIINMIIYARYQKFVLFMEHRVAAAW